MKKFILFAIAAVLLIATAISATIIISPDTAYVTSNLVCSVSPNPGAYLYKWFNGENYIKTGQTLGSSYLTRFNTYKCKVYLPPTPYTGEIYVGQALRTINNSAPTMPNLAITPGPYFANSTITATASGSTDANNDQIIYEYRYDRNSIAIGNSDVLACQGICNKTDFITVYARAYDNYDYSDWRTTSFTISNSVPYNLTITYLPIQVYSNSTLVITANANDTDNDPLTYNYLFLNTRFPSFFATLKP